MSGAPGGLWLRYIVCPFCMSDGCAGWCGVAGFLSTSVSLLCCARRRQKSSCDLEMEEIGWAVDVQKSNCWIEWFKMIFTMS